MQLPGKEITAQVKNDGLLTEKNQNLKFPKAFLKCQSIKYSIF